MVFDINNDTNLFISKLVDTPLAKLIAIDEFYDDETTIDGDSALHFRNFR